MPYLLWRREAIGILLHSNHEVCKVCSFIVRVLNNDWNDLARMKAHIPMAEELIIESIDAHFLTEWQRLQAYKSFKLEKVY